jgi:MFS transporter, DHA2 family, multidrug resistance protein
VHRTQQVASVSPRYATAIEALDQLAFSGCTLDQALISVKRPLELQAYTMTMTMTEIFYLSAVMFLMPIALVWLSNPKLKAGEAGAVQAGSY